MTLYIVFSLAACKSYKVFPCEFLFVNHHDKFIKIFLKMKYFSLNLLKRETSARHECNFLHNILIFKNVLGFCS